MYLNIGNIILHESYYGFTIWISWNLTLRLEHGKYDNWNVNWPQDLGTWYKVGWIFGPRLNTQ